MIHLSQSFLSLATVQENTCMFFNWIYQRQYHWTPAFQSYTVYSTNLNWHPFCCQRGGVWEWLKLNRTSMRGVSVSSEILYYWYMYLRDITWKKKLQAYKCSFKSIPLPLSSQPTSLIIPQSWDNSKHPIWSCIPHSHES